MACRITWLVLDCANPAKLASFWAEVLGYQISESAPDEVSISSPDGTDKPVRLLFLRSDEPKTTKLRLHLDVNATDRAQDAELERLLALGARHLDIGQGEQSWYVLGDPEGNEFCLLRDRANP